MYGTCSEEGKCDSVENERKANVWLCHQNGGEDRHGAGAIHLTFHSFVRGEKHK